MKTDNVKTDFRTVKATIGEIKINFMIHRLSKQNPAGLLSHYPTLNFP